MAIKTRNKIIFLVFASVLVWATVTYLLLFRTSDSSKDGKARFRLDVRKLDKEINELLAINENLLLMLKNHTLQRVGSSENMKEKDSKIMENNSNKQINGKDTGKHVENQSNSTDLKHSAPFENLDLLRSQRRPGDQTPIIAILVISCNRVTVKRCLDRLVKYRPNKQQFPIIVSQDCGHYQTSNVIKSYGDEIVHIKQPDQSEIEVPPREKKFRGYFKIARHYGWALNETFNHGFEAVVVVEDDLDVAPDFFEYFLGTYPILKSDPSIWCVSAWNDNGKSELIDSKSPHLLYRTDFFPGLGWMLTRNLWMELSVKWPKSYWDDWIRQPEQRKNRACIRPEVSRTRTFGRTGVSNGLFFDKHLQYIQLNEQFVPFTQLNLTYLLKENYDVAFTNQVYKSDIATHADVKNNLIQHNRPVRIPYSTRQSYKNSARMFGLMDDFKSGVPRTGYRGIVTFYNKGRRIYLAPSANWSGYDLSWN